jgi:hypothetical protein
MGTTVRLDGTLFDGSAPAEVDRWLEEARHEIGQQAYADVMTILNASIKRPTPYYETQIVHERVGATNVVHDRGIVYGPWLEGVSERNRTTRFKGYAAFRRATQQVERGLDRVLTPLVDRLTRRLS